MTSAVIVAAGSGVRMGYVGKLLLEIGGKPLIAHTILAFCEAESIDEIVVAAREEDIVFLDRDTFISAGSDTSLPDGMRMACVNMGNPHLVIFLDNCVDLSSYDIALLGRMFEKNTELFPEGVNVEFAILASPEAFADGHVVNNDEPTHIHMRVWERGCGETLACGTGACATAVVAVAFEGAHRRSVLHLLGGDLVIEWHSDNHVFMTGPAELVYQGTINL